MPFNMNDFYPNAPEHIKKINMSWDEVHREFEERVQGSMGYIFKLADGTTMKYNELSCSWNYYDEGRKVWTWAHDHLIEQGKARLKEMGMKLDGLCESCSADVVSSPRPKRKALQARIVELEKELISTGRARDFQIERSKDMQAAMEQMRENILGGKETNAEMAGEIQKLLGELERYRMPSRNTELKSELDIITREKMEVQHEMLGWATKAKELEAQLKMVEQVKMQLDARVKELEKGLEGAINARDIEIRKNREMAELVYYNANMTYKDRVKELESKLEKVKFDLTIARVHIEELEQQ